MFVRLLYGDAPMYAEFVVTTTAGSVRPSCSRLSMMIGTLPMFIQSDWSWPLPCCR